MNNGSFNLSGAYLGRIIFAVCLTFMFAQTQAAELSVYRGEPKPPPMRLQDIAGKLHDLKEYRGQVVLVNFWATWCPPCRAEMPSMWRLQNSLRGKPFKIIAVNIAESDAEVNTFLPDKMKQDFVALMDRDGVALKKWKVFAFPTSYLIDKKGRIRYALFGATEWDSKENKNTVVKLLNE